MEKKWHRCPFLENQCRSLIFWSDICCSWLCPIPWWLHYSVRHVACLISPIFLALENDVEQKSLALLWKSESLWTLSKLRTAIFHWQLIVQCDYTFSIIWLYIQYVLTLCWHRFCLILIFAGSIFLVPISDIRVSAYVLTLLRSWQSSTKRLVAHIFIAKKHGWA